MTKDPLVYIVVLTYKMRDVVAHCLASLTSLRYSNYRVVVVDNASGDGTAAMVEERFPQFVMLESAENSGYTGGNNLGIRYALERGAEYVLILNPDTELLNPDFLSEMVEYARTHAQVGIAGPRVFLRDADTVQNTVLYPPGLWRSLVNWVWYRLNPGAYFYSGDEVVEAPVLNGVCLLLRAECLRQIGLFDEAIFMYIEDADMDWRARRQGWGVRYLPIDSVIHRQKREGYHMTSFVSFLLKRNSVYYLCKTGQRFEAWGYAALSLLLLLARGALTLRPQGLREYLGFTRRLGQAYWLLLRSDFTQRAWFETEWKNGIDGNNGGNG